VNECKPLLLGFAPFASEMPGADDTTTYKNILSGNFRIPPGVLTPEAFSFVYGLLTVGPGTSSLPRHQTHSETCFLELKTFLPRLQLPGWGA
jgi:hypothetical protein